MGPVVALLPQPIPKENETDETLDGQEPISYRLKTNCLQDVNADMLSSISCCADSVRTVLSFFKSIRHPDHMKQVAVAENPDHIPW